MVEGLGDLYVMVKLDIDGHINMVACVAPYAATETAG